MAKVYLEIKKSDTTLTVRKKLRKLYPNLSCVFSSKFDTTPPVSCMYGVSYKLNELFKSMKEGKIDISPERSVVAAWEEFKKKLNVNISFNHSFFSYPDDYPLGYIGQYFTDCPEVTFADFNKKRKKGEIYEFL